MECAYHPGQTAYTRCVDCGKPLCDMCAPPEHVGSTICSYCESLQAMTSFNEELRDRQAALAAEKAARRKKIAIKATYVLCALLFVVVGGFNLFLLYSHPEPELDSINLEENPVSATVLVDSAIRTFAERNDGAVPENIDDLVGDYLPDDIPIDLLNFVRYEKTSENTYVLKLDVGNLKGLPPLVLTEKGPSY